MTPAPFPPWVGPLSSSHLPHHESHSRPDLASHESGCPFLPFVPTGIECSRSTFRGQRRRFVPGERGDPDAPFHTRSEEIPPGALPLRQPSPEQGDEINRIQRGGARRSFGGRNRLRRGLRFGRSDRFLGDRLCGGSGRCGRSSLFSGRDQIRGSDFKRWRGGLGLSHRIGGYRAQLRCRGFSRDRRRSGQCRLLGLHRVHRLRELSRLRRMYWLRWVDGRHWPNRGPGITPLTSADFSNERHGNQGWRPRDPRPPLMFMTGDRSSRR